MFILHKKYMARGYKGDQPFFGISKVFWCIEGWNMMAIMLDLCFKSLHGAENLAGTWKCNLINIQIWCQDCHYSCNGIFWLAKPYCQCICCNNNWCWRTILKKMVGVEASNKESSQALVIGKLSLFSRLFSPIYMCKSH
jgi:hypothetical protein